MKLSSRNGRITSQSTQVLMQSLEKFSRSAKSSRQSLSSRKWMLMSWLGTDLWSYFQLSLSVSQILSSIQPLLLAVTMVTKFWMSTCTSETSTKLEQKRNYLGMRNSSSVKSFIGKDQVEFSPTHQPGNLLLAPPSYQKYLSSTEQLFQTTSLPWFSMELDSQEWLRPQFIHPPRWPSSKQILTMIDLHTNIYF